MTPMDFTYSHSMLPANLLSTPSPYVGNGHSFMPPVSLPSMYSRRPFLASSLVATPPFSPGPTNMDLHLPRTVVFSGVSSGVTARMFLDTLGFGPVEECKAVAHEELDTTPKSLAETSGIESSGLRKAAVSPGASGDCAAKYPAASTQKEVKSDSPMENPHDEAQVSFHVSFLSHPTALHCLNKYSKNSSDIREKLNSPNLKVTFDLPDSSRALKPKVFKYVVEHDATRAVSICFKILDLDLVPLMEKSFRARCRNFGEVDEFKVTEHELHIEYIVHFLTIETAIKIYDYHRKRMFRSEASSASDTELQCIAVSFHRDRCEVLEIPNPPVPQSEGSVSKDSMTNELSLHELEERSDVSSNSALSEFTSPDHFHLEMMGASETQNYPYPMLQRVPFLQIPSFPNNPDPLNNCNRTLCLGNLHPKTTVEEIANNVRAGGLVESIKYCRRKRVCFITFVDPKIALKFYLNHQVLYQLVIRDNVVSVNWGRNHLGPLPMKLASAAMSGACRNVYIGLKLHKGKGEKPKLPDENTLREDFSHFGDLEQINYVHSKDCGFMNFMSIHDAIKVVSYFEAGNKTKISQIADDNGELYEKYRVFKISFGKDRCANPLKFSFKKMTRTERADQIEQPKIQAPADDASDKSISQEAAMVFGIQTPKRNNNGDDRSKTGEGERSREGVKLDELSDSELDDDIAIIIESEGPAKPVPPKPKKKTQKVYHNDYDLTELLSAAFNTYGYGYGFQQPPCGHFPGMGEERQADASGHYFDAAYQMPYGLANQYTGYGGNCGSGSQMAAQYLAKTEQENGHLPSTAKEPRRRRKKR